MVAKMAQAGRVYQKINGLRTWQGDCSLLCVLNKMSAQGTVVAPRKNSSSF
jgi:hypothetical protein